MSQPCNPNPPPRIDVDRLKALVDVRELAEALTGQEIRGGKIRCPAHEDRNPSCSVHQGYWKCHSASCEAKGDAINFVQAVHGFDFKDAAAFLARWARVDLTHSRRPLAQPAAMPKPAQRPPSYPPRAEVLALWDSGRELEREDEVASFVAGRGVDPGLIPACVARALPRCAACPPWAHCGAPWSRRHRLLFGLFDAAGELRSLKARDVTGQSRVKEPTSKGFGAQGLCYASSGAQAMLRYPRSLVPERTTVIVGEGGPDFLALAAARPDCPTLGIAGSGTWRKSLADRIPSGATVVIATDQDDAGERYAREIASHVRDRCAVQRYRGAA